MCWCFIHYWIEKCTVKQWNTYVSFTPKCRIQSQFSSTPRNMKLKISWMFSVLLKIGHDINSPLTLLASITFSDNQSESTPFPAFFLHCLALEDWTDRMSRNVDKTPSIYAALTAHKSEYLIDTAAEACSHATDDCFFWDKTLRGSLHRQAYQRPRNVIYLPDYKE